MAAISQPGRKRGRPPSTQAEGSETRELLLRAGVAALTEKGFSATGIDEILRAAGVPKGSFYYYFQSKEAFGAELIQRYAEYFALKLDRHFLNDLLSPLNRLRAFIADADSSMQRFHFRRGCLIGNLGQEMGALPESYRAQLAEVFCDWQARTAQCLEAARTAGEIPASADPVRLAAFFWIGWEGAVLRAKLERQSGPIRLFAQSFLDSLRGSA
jgi:TetR/AcrR family transcriptional regulator, transcriptional repressor for nem operon